MKLKIRFHAGLTTTADVGTLLLLTGHHDAIVALLEPLHRLGDLDAVGVAHAGVAVLTVTDALSTASENDVEVHTVDTCGGIVLETEVDMLADSETEGSGVGEVVAEELELLDLETLLEELGGLLAADGGVDGDLLVTTDTEGTDGEAGTGHDGGLAAELLEHLHGTGQTITGLSDADVDAELAHADLAHRVGCLLLGGHDYFYKLK